MIGFSKCAETECEEKGGEGRREKKREGRTENGEEGGRGITHLLPKGSLRLHTRAT
jgi:hypothetical protein